MFSEKITSYIESAAPELYRPEICVNGKQLSLNDCDRINSLIIRNNLLSEEKGNIAIFNPPNIYGDSFMTIAAGLACYKAGLGKSNITELNLIPGILVFYQGDILKFQGWDKDKKIILTHEDKLKTTITISADSISEITIYSGDRTMPDVAGARTRIPAIQKTLRRLLNLTEGQQMQLANCGSIIVCLPETSLIDELKKTTINNTPFFDLFPSIKWTSGNEQRLGRDHKKRTPIFYFVGSLSSADDLLRLEAGRGIHTLICDGQRTGRSASLLLSIKSGQALKNIFIIDEISNIESMSKFKQLDFQIWVWTKDDLSSDKKSTVIQKIPYPSTFSLDAHIELQNCISQLYHINRAQENTALKEFIISVYGLSNKIFQTPTSFEVLNNKTSLSGQIYFETLKLKAALLKGQLAAQIIPVLDRLLELLEQATLAFSADKSKYEAILKILRGFDIKNTVIAVKRSNLIEPLENLIIKDLNSETYNIISSPKNLDESSILVWTFRPDLQKYAESVMRVKKSIFVGYERQVEEFYLIENQYAQKVNRYSDLKNRMQILKIDPLLFDSPEQENLVVENENLEKFVEFENTLLASSGFSRPYNPNEIDEGKIVPARRVVFIGGFIAFIGPRNPLRVIGYEEQKVVGELQQGDKIIFLRDKRDTIFDELIGYYQHKPEIIKILKLSEAWRTALLEYQKINNLTTLQIQDRLATGGLDRTEFTIENWLKGKVICPFEDDYRPVDIIAGVTGNIFLTQNKEKIKIAARRVHSIHIKIGSYLAKRILQSAGLEENFDKDITLQKKLDKVSSYAEIAEVALVSPDIVGVDPALANRLLSMEDL